MTGCRRSANWPRGLGREFTQPFLPINRFFTPFGHGCIRWRCGRGNMSCIIKPDVVPVEYLRQCITGRYVLLYITVLECTRKGHMIYIHQCIYRSVRSAIILLAMHVDIGILCKKYRRRLHDLNNIVSQQLTQ